MRKTFIYAALLFTAVSLLAIPVGAARESEERSGVVSKLVSTLSDKVKDDAQHIEEQVNQAQTRIAEQRKANEHSRAQVPPVATNQSPAATEPDTKQKNSEKKKICVNNQNRINTLMNAMDTRRSNAFAHISEISDATQAFYNRKSLNIENYDSLLAAVNSAKVAAQNAKDSQLSVPKFDCNGVAPGNDLQAFRDKRAASIATITIYREAVKKLINAVRDTYKSSTSTEEVVNS